MQGAGEHWQIQPADGGSGEHGLAKLECVGGISSQRHHERTEADLEQSGDPALIVDAPARGRVDAVVAGSLDGHVGIPSNLVEVPATVARVLSMAIVGRRRPEHPKRP